MMRAQIPNDQETAGWDHPWPEDGDQCPYCHHGVLEVQAFGQGRGLEVHAWCGGLDGVKLEDADDSDLDRCGCGWAGIFHPGLSVGTKPKQL